MNRCLHPFLLGIFGLCVIVACGCGGGFDIPGVGTPPADDDDSADTPADDDDDPEVVPGADEPPPAEVPPLCHVELTCNEEVPDDPKIPCELLIQEQAGTVLYDGWAGVELRGRSSSSFPKPHYGVELWEGQSGPPTGENFFSMGRDSDWILNGNYADRSLFRNKLSFDLFQQYTEQGYATETVLCELSLNQSWLGVFTLGERIKRDDDRVDLLEDPQGLGGSFIVKSDDGGGGIVASPSTYGEWFLVYPKADEISAQARIGVVEALEAWEGAALGPDPCNEATGIFAKMDLDSAVDWVLIQELSKNNDAYFLSIYVYRDLDEKLQLIPWDHDLAWGGYPVGNCHAQDWIAYRPSLIQAMASCPAFQDRLTERWFELREDALSQDNILLRMELYRDVIGDVAYDNFDVWLMEDIEFSWDDTNWLCPVSTYDEEMTRFQEWVSARLDWMDTNIQYY